MTPSGSSFDIVHSFAGGSGGSLPNGGLATDGKQFFGTTREGGATGAGLVFRF